MSPDNGDAYRGSSRKIGLLHLAEPLTLLSYEAFISRPTALAGHSSGIFGNMGFIVWGGKYTKALHMEHSKVNHYRS